MLPLGATSFEVEDDDECSMLVEGATATGTATIRAGATTTGAGYTVTIFGAWRRRGSVRCYGVRGRGESDGWTS